MLAVAEWLHALHKLPTNCWSHFATLVHHLCKQVGMEEGGIVTAKVPGELMAHYYVKFRTMVALITAPSHASLPDLIMLLGAHCAAPTLFQPSHDAHVGLTSCLAAAAKLRATATPVGLFAYAAHPLGSMWVPYGCSQGGGLVTVVRSEEMLNVPLVMFLCPSCCSQQPGVCHHCPAAK